MPMKTVGRLILLLGCVACVAATSGYEDALPPEKTQMIYDALLPAGKDAPAGNDQPAAAAVSSKKADTPADRVTKMVRARGIPLRGRPGQWEFVYGNRQVFLVIDPGKNSVRLLSPVAELDQLRRGADFDETEFFSRMLKANYLVTGEIRFCLNRQVVWLAFVHPLDTLTEEHLFNALDQIVAIADSTSRRQ